MAGLSLPESQRKYAAQYNLFQQNAFEVLNRNTCFIFRLDPALPLFGVAEDDGRIDPTDAGK